MFSIDRALSARVSALAGRQVTASSLAHRALRSATALLKGLALVSFALLMMRATVSVASPLTTDDTGTVGKDKKQFEASAEYSTFDDHLERVWTPEFTYGLSDTVDLTMNLPYQHLKQEAPEPSARGINDPSLNLKWRFYEKDGLSFAFAPSITGPLADEEDGLGNGRATYRAIGLMQYESGDFTWLLNGGYIRNNNVADDRRDLWSISGGAYYQFNPKAKLGVDYGYNSDTDPNITRLEHFIGAAAVYSPNEQLDFTLGYKHGFNRDSLNHAWRASVVVHW